jgi:arylsulfatase A-like enzyme
VLQHPSRAASAGCLLGAAAAILTALSDFGAQWLWLERPDERALLLARLVGFQLPLGAACGAALGATWAWARRRLENPGGDRARHAMRENVLLTLMASPAVAWIGLSLFEGGSMSRLPLLPLWKATALTCLLAGTFGTIRGARLLWRRARARGIERLAFALVALGLGELLGKFDQRLYPKLYEDLHAALSLGAFALFAWGIALACAPLAPRIRSAHAWTAGGLLLALLVGTLVDLDRSQNVRGALLHPRASHSRSLLRGVGPVLLAPRERIAVGRARERARRARKRRAEARPASGGPVAADAHVLVITVDALRADHLGTYGYGRGISPELDALAREGVVFERAYAPAPHSSYSLSSLMTSEYLHETVELGHPLPRKTLATTLAQAGYHTAAFFTRGIFHTAGERLHDYERNAFGFAFRDHVCRPAQQLTDAVLAEVDRTVARGEPNTLLWAHYFDVHEPYRASELGETPMDRYDSEVLRVDAAIARLVRQARRRLSRDVIVVITSDHGEEFRDHGGLYHGSTLYEEQVRVPLVILAPGLTPRRVSAPVETLDLSPTLLSWVGITPPPSMRGQDLRALATGEESERGPVVSAVGSKKMVLRWPYKLIADLRFGHFELYDLRSDPRERANLADAEPQRVDAMRGEIYAWLDSLTPAATETDPVALALDQGRLGDRRAVPALCGHLLDDEAPPGTRVEAVQILGHLRDPRAREPLADALHASNPQVAAEAAIALGRMYDARARDALRALVQSPDLRTRTRAAVSLGRLRDRLAVPALIEALQAEAKYEREEAVRWLGRLRDPRALQPLLSTLSDPRRRYLTTIALGMVGDAGAYASLEHLARWGTQQNVRDGAIRGLGTLGDPRAIESLLPIAAHEATLKNTGETLVRLGAIQRGDVGGTDVGPDSHGHRGLARCRAKNPLHDWDYLNRTTCVTTHRRSSLRLRIPREVAQAPEGLVALLSVRRVDAPTATALSVQLGRKSLQSLTVDGAWSELRVPLPEGAVRAGRMRAILTARDPGARFAVDHLLILPRVPVELAHLSD